MNKQFIGSDNKANPFGNADRLCDIIDHARPISRKTFLKNCNVSNVNVFGMSFEDISQFPRDLEYFRHRDIMFFTHSCIEFFFR